MEMLEQLTPNSRTRVLAAILRTTKNDALRDRALEMLRIEVEAQRRWHEEANIG